MDLARLLELEDLPGERYVAHLRAPRSAREAASARSCS